MKTKNERIEIVVLAVFLAVGVFVIDYITIPQAAVSILYVAPVLLSLFTPGRKFAIVISVLCSLLAIAGFIIDDFSKMDIVIFMNRTISIIGIWSAFYFIMKFKSSEITEYKNKERLNALFEYATEGILITNHKGEIVLINPIAEKQFGYMKDELLNKPIEILIPERIGQRHHKHRENYIQKPYPRPMGRGMELYGRKKDNSEFPVEISLSNFVTDEGKFVIAFIIDISERKLNEELFRKEKEVAQMYLDLAPVIFIVINKDQTIKLINQTGCNFLGYQEKDIIGNNWFDKFVHKSVKEQSRTGFIKMMDGESEIATNNEYEIENAEGKSKLIAWKSTIIRDERGNPVATLSSGEDISDRKRQEKIIDQANQALKRYSEEILDLNADLEKRVEQRTLELAEVIKKVELTNEELAVEIKERTQAEKELERNREELKLALEKEKELSELKSRFVTMASHEFRTPLSTIMSSASLISKYNEIEQEEKRIKHIERIKSSVNNLTSILNDFLSLGKLEEGKIQCSPTEFDIVSFSNDLINELREVTKKGQEIKFRHQGESTKVFLDKNLTRNICINLVSNAIKYSDESQPILFHTNVKKNELEIEVADKGIGIPENEQQNIFERFFRANNASNIQGTGLGLNIVKKYTELMNGTISFTSKFGSGTVFTVKLPLDNPVNQN